MKKPDHIHPIFDRLISREERENRLCQRSKVLWFTGLSGSGKSTIAEALERKLFENQFFAQVLDGDNIRSGINSNLTFSPEDRTENIRRIAEISKLFIHAGVITLNSFISPTIEIRDMVRKIVGAENFIEIFINTPLEICEERDVKGLYKKARAGEIPNFTGISAPYESPVQPDVEILTANQTINESVDQVYKSILPNIIF